MTMLVEKLTTAAVDHFTYLVVGMALLVLTIAAIVAALAVLLIVSTWLHRRYPKIDRLGPPAARLGEIALYAALVGFIVVYAWGTGREAVARFAEPAALEDPNHAG